MKTLQILALTLTIVGALNWAMIGLFDFNLFATIFGGNDAIGSRIVYILVGISGLINIKTLANLISEEE